MDSEIGLNFIVGLESTTLSSEEALQLKQLSPAGIILFKHNINQASENWIESLSKLIDDAKNAIGRDELFVSIDHEGGRVHRLKLPVTHFAAANTWKEKTADVAKAMALELKALGINLSYSPVLDVFSEPQNTVIGDRAFASEPEEVSRLGKVFVSSLQKNGVFACVKHFPGHGATIADSHFELPLLNISKELISKRELFPFSKVCESSSLQDDVHFLMTAHVLYPALDENNPATLSQRIIQDILRNDLCYKGVVLSDDMEMAAVTSFSLKDRAIQAISAGVDILLVGNPKDKKSSTRALEMSEGIKEQISLDKSFAKNVEQSHQRVEKVLSILKEPFMNYSPGLEILNCSEHKLLAESLK